VTKRRQLQNARRPKQAPETGSGIVTGSLQRFVLAAPKSGATYGTVF
jgi:hypothetical protein